MNCSDRDQDILLLEHDALGGVRRWSTERHLRNCPRCQERREQHAHVSRLVGATVREAGPDLRVLYGGAAVAAATTAAAASGARGVGRGRLRPVQPLIRPAFVGAWAAVAAIVAAGAWIYKATALAPGYEHMATPAPDIRRPYRFGEPRQSVVPPGAGTVAAAAAPSAAGPGGFATRVGSGAVVPSPPAPAAAPSPGAACPARRDGGPFQQAALLPPPVMRAAAGVAPQQPQEARATPMPAPSPPAVAASSCGL